MSDDFREHSNDTIFKDAVDAMRRGDKVRAKDLLTRLLKSDQNNAKYWMAQRGGGFAQGTHLLHRNRAQTGP